MAAATSKKPASNAYQLCSVNQAGSVIIEKLSESSIANIKDRIYISADWSSKTVLDKHFDQDECDRVISIQSKLLASAQSDTITLEECLHLFSSPEVLGKENMWFVIDCANYRRLGSPQ